MLLLAVLAFLVLYLPPATWLFFLAAMAYDRAKHSGGNSEIASRLAAVIKPFALLHNALFNVLLMTFWFLDLPRELATTARLNRYVNGPPGWRRRRALAMRDAWLNRYDRRGVHT